MLEMSSQQSRRIASNNGNGFVGSVYQALLFDTALDVDSIKTMQRGFLQRTKNQPAFKLAGEITSI